MRDLNQITCKESNLKIKEGREKGGEIELNCMKFGSVLVLPLLSSEI